MSNWCGTPKADRLTVEMLKLCQDHGPADVLAEMIGYISANKGQGPCGHDHPNTITVSKAGWGTTVTYKVCQCGAMWRV